MCVLFNDQSTRYFNKMAEIDRVAITNRVQDLHEITQDAIIYKAVTYVMVDVVYLSSTGQELKIPIISMLGTTRVLNIMPSQFGLEVYQMN